MSDKEVRIIFNGDSIAYVEIEFYEYPPVGDRLTFRWNTEYAKKYELSDEDFLRQNPSYRDITTIGIATGRNYVVIEYFDKNGTMHLKRYIPNHIIINIIYQDKIPLSVNDLSAEVQENSK